MTECPCCYRMAVGDDGECTRCHVQTKTGEPNPPWRDAPQRVRPTQEPWETDYSRTKEDHQ